MRIILPVLFSLGAALALPLTQAGSLESRSARPGLSRSQSLELARSERPRGRRADAARPRSQAQVHEGARDRHVDRSLGNLDRLGAEQDRRPARSRSTSTNGVTRSRWPTSRRPACRTTSTRGSPTRTSSFRNSRARSTSSSPTRTRSAYTNYFVAVWPKLQAAVVSQRTTCRARGRPASASSWPTSRPSRTPRPRSIEAAAPGCRSRLRNRQGVRHSAFGIRN